MNAHAQIDSKARDYARAARAAEYAADWARMVNTMDEPFWRARMLDALQWCSASDLSDEIHECLRESGLDAEGYPVDDAGDVCPDGERQFFPTADVFGRAA